MELLNASPTGYQSEIIWGPTLRPQQSQKLGHQACVQASSRDVLILSGQEKEGRGRVCWLPQSLGRIAVNP